MVHLQPHEHVVFVSRRHWWVFFMTVLKTLLLVLLFFVAVFSVGWWYPSISLISAEFIGLLGALILEILWLSLFLAIADFYLDAWVVTNQRLIFVEIRGLFNQTINSLDYRNVQDVSASVQGIIATFLDFGDVTVQSAGTHGTFRFHEVGHPNQVKEHILAVRNQFLEKNAAA